ncbi:MAG: electron transfer flavoprotein subunit alpha/FixB family protein [Acidimicrobiales bacterium]|jgi:electron transfer flavoprotein alpha subunit|nr:electron transfer flavoprotein subunit alpha/FixB family protein [Acidimicrobiales bacterium]
MPGLYVFIEHDQGSFSPASREALTAARKLGERLQEPVVATHIGKANPEFKALCEEYGVLEGVILEDPKLLDYGPELWGQAIADLLALRNPRVVLSIGTDRGNEVLAQASARTGIPFVANCVDVSYGQGWNLTRLQWGGSLLEDSAVDSPTIFLTYAHHSVDDVPTPAPTEAVIDAVELDLDPILSRTMIQDRVTLTEGTTLSTAAVVVSGGRGVGSSEGFACLEELAELLSGKVGCSRAVTNNGWRSHADQVGQTGTRIAPEIYIACGISGAIQHWVGAMASKNILAINTDPEANMVTKAGYAVIGDLHEVIPAVISEIRQRRGMGS